MYEGDNYVLVIASHVEKGTYDAAGRVLERREKRLSRKPDVWRYKWDAADRLTACTTPDATRWTYRYDPLGLAPCMQSLEDMAHKMSQVLPNERQREGQTVAIIATRHKAGTSSSSPEPARLSHRRQFYWPSRYAPETDQDEHVNYPRVPAGLLTREFLPGITDALENTDGRLLRDGTHWLVTRHKGTISVGRVGTDPSQVLADRTTWTNPAPNDPSQYCSPTARRRPGHQYPGGRHCLRDRRNQPVGAPPPGLAAIARRRRRMHGRPSRPGTSGDHGRTPRTRRALRGRHLPRPRPGHRRSARRARPAVLLSDVRLPAVPGRTPRGPAHRLHGPGRHPLPPGHLHGRRARRPGGGHRRGTLRRPRYGRGAGQPGCRRRIPLPHAGRRRRRHHRGRRRTVRGLGLRRLHPRAAAWLSPSAVRACATRARKRCRSTAEASTART